MRRNASRAGRRGPLAALATVTARPIQSLLATAALFAGAVLLALGATGGSYALWNDNVETPSASISTGSIGLTVQGVTNYTVSGLTVTQLLPGRSVVTPTTLALKNTGTVPLSITLGTTQFTATSTALSNAINVAVRQQSACAITTTTANPNPVSLTAPIVLAVGQTVPICVEVGLAANAPASVQGQNATFTLPLVAVQKRP